MHVATWATVAARFERIDTRGRSQQELFDDSGVRPNRRKSSPWAADIDGYSVEAGVHFGALDCEGREKLVRYLGHADTVAFDVTGEPLPDWLVGVDPEPPDPVERAPPRDWDCVDPPAPDV